MSKENHRQRAEKAAAALRERERRERRRQILTVIGVLAAIVLIVGGGFLVNSLRDTSEDVAANAPAVGSAHGVTIGPESAANKIVLYVDFLCPVCGEFEKQTSTELAALADEGKVQVEYRPFVLLDNYGPYSALATQVFAVVLDQSGPDIAKDFLDVLFQNQPSEGGPFPSVEEVVQLSGEAGADTTAVQAAMDSGEGEAWTNDATQAAADLGVDGTPTVILNGAPFTDGRNIDDLAANLLKAVQ
jgi:protein-disulfide isomerase